MGMRVQSIAPTTPGILLVSMNRRAAPAKGSYSGNWMNSLYFEERKRETLCITLLIVACVTPNKSTI